MRVLNQIIWRAKDTLILGHDASPLDDLPLRSSLSHPGWPYARQRHSYVVEESFSPVHMLLDWPVVSMMWLLQMSGCKA